MKAIRIHGYGGPEVLRYEQAPRPVPREGQVLVRIAGASFNPGDVVNRAGGMRAVHAFAMPHILGLDMAGTVIGGGPVMSFLPWPASGGYAEYVAVVPEALAPAPTSIPLADAAALPVAGLTAWQAIHEQLRVRPGQRILVNGAGGGVGRLAVQFAKLAGATVIAVAGPHSVASARRAGADEVHDYTTRWRTDPVDGVLQAAPRAGAGLASLVRPGGTIVSISAPMPGCRADVPSTSFELRRDVAQLVGIARLVDAGAVDPGVAERLPLARAAEVHRRHAAGRLHGKVVLIP